MNKPVFLFDLDDTLFQTKRKMVNEQGLIPHRPAALDRSLQPRSYMTEEQAMLVDWMLQHANFIPVTARGTDEIARVQIPFSSWQITTHGAVILTPQGEPDREWQDHILTALAAYRERLLSLETHINQRMQAQGVDAWCRINFEYGDTPIYFVMKHRDSTRLDELYRFHDELKASVSTEGFYIHQNSNNIAWLPHCIDKGLATRYLLDKLRAACGPFPVLGMGDSLTDFSFMQHCHWFGMPNRSQFSHVIEAALRPGESNE